MASKTKVSNPGTALIIEPAPGLLLLDDKLATRPKQSGGIYLPEGGIVDQNQAPIGRIQKVGAGVEGYAPGDVVYYRLHSDFVLSIDNMRVRVVEPKNVLAKVRGYDPKIDVWGQK